LTAKHPPATLAVASAAGSPMDPKTWSGTPYNIIRALEAEGARVIPVNTSIQPRAVRAAHQLLYRAIGRGRDYLRGSLAHRHSVRILEAALRGSTSPRVLHTGSLDVPLHPDRNGRRHDLFCDSTWRLWSSRATNIAGYPARAIAAAEVIERRAYQNIEHFYPIARYVADDLVSSYGIPRERITVVGTGRGNVQPMQGLRNDEAREILFVGKVRFEDKGGPLLIEAFRIARRRDPRLTLTLVAEEKYRPLIAGIPGVTLHGFLPWDDLQRLFNRANLFAMPAMNEPWGLVYLEALGCGTPILGLNRNSVPEIAGDGRFGFVVDDAVPEAIAEAIADAFSDPVRLRAMGDAGQAHCLARYSWSRVAKLILGEPDPHEEQTDVA